MYKGPPLSVSDGEGMVVGRLRNKKRRKHFVSSFVLFLCGGLEMVFGECKEQLPMNAKD